MLIEIHILQNHAPSNLNRDDTGSPKEAVFGGHKRARISSQCIKRSIRRSEVFQALFEEGAASTRTRSLPILVRDRLLSEAGRLVDGREKEALTTLADVAAQKLKAVAKSERKGDGENKQKGDDGKKPVTAQTIFFRSEELTSIYEEVKRRLLWDSSLESLLSATKDQKESVARNTINSTKLPAELQAAIERLLGAPDTESDEELGDSSGDPSEETKGGKKKTLQDRLKTLSIRHGSAVALTKAARIDVNGKIPIDIALFGRMVTNPAFLHVEASSQFAHAISTHKIDHEFDYYTAVDDLERSADDDAGGGADMIGDVEFNSACYYKYFNVHVEGLVENLTGKAFTRKVTEEDELTARQTAAKAIRALIESACRVTPSGKQNSFAAHQPPSLIWIEVRESNLPVSYANAFCVPVNPRNIDGLEKGSANALKAEAEALTKMYGLEARKRLLLAKEGTFEILGAKSSESLKTVLDLVEEEVVRG